MLKLGLVVIAAFVLQAALSMIQMKHFSNEFIRLRRQGKVACGRQAGGFHAGAIVMFQIDDDGMIRAARKLEGVTCLARVRPMEGFEGRYIGDLTGEEVSKTHRNLRKAVRDAVLSYRKFMAGEAIPEPPTPFQRAGRSITGAFRKRKAEI